MSDMPLQFVRDGERRYCVVRMNYETSHYDRLGFVFQARHEHRRKQSWRWFFERLDGSKAGSPLQGCTTRGAAADLLVSSIENTVTS